MDERNVLLVTDTHRARRTCSVQDGMSHASTDVGGGERFRGAVHVQDAQAGYRRSRQWLGRFNGEVLRYLPNYPGWQWPVDGQRVGSARWLLCLAPNIVNSLATER